MSKRTFTVHDARKAGGCKTKFAKKNYTGVFVSKSASGAASKAFSKLCRVKKIKGQCSLLLTMRETTQGKKTKADGSPKLYNYRLTREKLKVPLELKGRVINYKNTCKSMKNMPAVPKKGCKKSSGSMK